MKSAFAALDVKLTGDIAALDAKLITRIAAIETPLSDTKAELVRRIVTSIAAARLVAAK